MGIHSLLAGVTGVDYLALQEDEAKALSKAAVEVSKHYDMTMDGKAFDWINLFSVLGSVYGVRFMVYTKERKHKQKQAKDNAKISVAG